MKRLLLPLLAALALPLEPIFAFENIGTNAELKGKHENTCEAYDRGYLTIEQRDQLLIEAYDSWDEEYKGNRRERFKEIESEIRYRKYSYPNCFEALEKYILDKKNKK